MSTNTLTGKLRSRFQLLAASAALLVLGATASAVPFALTGYSQNFDSMGTSGTALPADWTFWNGEAGTTNVTWATSITANGATGSVPSMIQSTAALTATTTPTGTNNNGFNAAASAGTPSDRVVATSPTTISGSALQVVLTNNTGAGLSGFTISYGIQRYSSVATANELPGYQLFFSLDNSTWTNVSGLNPTLTTVPNSTGTTPVAGLVTFGSVLTDGSTFRLRWVDDNAFQTSPDQIIGLNNVVLSTPLAAPAVPDHGSTFWLALPLMAGLAAQQLRRRALLAA